MSILNAPYHVDRDSNLIHREDEIDASPLVFVHWTNTSWKSNPDTSSLLWKTPAEQANDMRIRWTSRDSLIRRLLDTAIDVYSSGIHPDTHGRLWDPETDPRLRDLAMKEASARVIWIHDDVLGIPTITDTYQAILTSVQDRVPLIVHFSGQRDSQGNLLYIPTGNLIQSVDPRTQIELDEAIRIWTMERRKLERFLRDHSLWAHITIAETYDQVFEILRKNNIIG